MKPEQPAVPTLNSRLFGCQVRKKHVTHCSAVWVLCSAEHCHHTLGSLDSKRGFFFQSHADLSQNMGAVPAPRGYAGVEGVWGGCPVHDDSNNDNSDNNDADNDTHWLLCSQHTAKIAVGAMQLIFRPLTKMYALWCTCWKPRSAHCRAMSSCASCLWRSQSHILQCIVTQYVLLLEDTVQLAGSLYCSTL